MPKRNPYSPTTPIPKQNCLFIDDEPKVLKALKRALHREPYTCRFAPSGDQALVMMAERPADVVVTDMHMPSMHGLTLLSHVAERCPHAIRLVLSGETRAEEILNAINDGQVYRYIVKPWDDRELKTILRQALEIGKLKLQKRQLIETLQSHNRDLERRVEERTAQLLKIRNQAEIGKYASQIVHDLNNPLHGISGIVDLLLHALNVQKRMDAEEMKTWLEMAQKGTEDLKTIISGILLHVRDPSHLETDQVNINNLIKQELKFFDLDRHFLKEVQRKIELAENLPSISGHTVQFKQVVDNLIRNGWDAMADAKKKQLTIQTSEVDGWIIIKVKDTGEGISSKNIDRIFDPDYSTKPVGKGTGLGLASVKTMVEAYSGTIGVQSRLGQGTTFTIKLPLNPELLTALPHHPSL